MDLERVRGGGLEAGWQLREEGVVVSMESYMKK